MNKKSAFNNTAIFLLSFFLLAAACSSPGGNSANRNKETTQAVQNTINAYDTDTVAFKTYYIVQVAEGYDYGKLGKISREAAVYLNSHVDYLDRIYKQGKGIIYPPADCGDPGYCGQYFPRRPMYDQNFVSIEMKYYYYGIPVHSKEADLKMIVVANIFDEKSSADSLVNILSDSFKEAKTLKSIIYMGCMH